MNKIGIIIIFLFSFFLGGAVSAHPLDITGSEIVIDSQTGEIEVSTFIHPFLVNLLLEQEELPATKVEIIYDHPEVLTNYFQDSFYIKNGATKCKITSFNLPPKDEIEILGGGVELEVGLQCSSPIGRIEFLNKMFIEYSILQTNQTFFYNKGDVRNSIFEKILTAKIYSSSFDYNDPSQLVVEKDTDGDGLSDDEEEIYKTNKNNSDTDGDGYTDKEEIDNGWNSLEFKPSMGQKVRVEKLIEPQVVIEKDVEDSSSAREGGFKEAEAVMQKEYKKGESKAQEAVDKKVITFEKLSKESKLAVVEEIATSSDSIPITLESSDNDSGAKYFKTGKLEKYLVKIKELFDSGSFFNISLIFIFIYFLGILHAFESGHGKSILISYLMEKERKISDGVKFSAFLSITHLIDVVILVVLFKVFSLVGESQKFIFLIQKAGAYILLAVALFYLVQNLLPKKSCRRYKSGGVLGIIAGLAPCTIGWALMIMIISIDKVNWLIPIIVVFGLGIFSTLVVFSYLIIKLKDKIIGDSERISKYAGIASSLVLLIIALTLIFKY